MELSKIMKRKIMDYLKEGKRFDGRAALDFRALTIETGISKNAEGSARVKLGNTEVLVGVKMNVCVPYTDHEGEGTMITTAELLPLSSDRFEPGPPGIESVETARIVDRGLRESKFIDFEKLCIKEGEKVWGIFLDLYSLNADGNLIDAFSIAAIAAILSAKMPKYDEVKGIVNYGEWTDQSIPVTDKLPINLTFHKIGKNILLDPTREEEDSSEARLSLALSRTNNKLYINAAQKGGEEAFTEEELNEMLDNAEKCYEKLEKEFKKHMERVKKA